jgi:predicted RNase H-like HicB family nuclease
MRFEGNLLRDGRLWMAEIPLLDAATQGRTRAEALTMIGDWLETMVNRPHFKAEVHPRGKFEFEVSGSDAAAMTALLLRRRREASGASLRDVATRLGSSSRNAYARYERGEAVPTVEKLDALLKATAPGEDFVIRESTR